MKSRNATKSWRGGLRMRCRAGEVNFSLRQELNAQFNVRSARSRRRLVRPGSPVRHPCAPETAMVNRNVREKLENDRVEMWRRGCRSNISVSAPFVWRCLSGSTVTPFPHPAHRTGRADLPHPALGQDLTPLLSRATPSAVSEPFTEFIGFPISQVLHHVLRLS